MKSKIETALFALIASKIQKYGELTDLMIDKEKSQIALQFLLDGETQTISVVFAGCTIENGRFNARFVKASRAWIQRILVENPELIRFAIPKELSFLAQNIFKGNK